MTPAQLGSLPAGTAEPGLWFLPELVRCSGQVLARSGNGDLYFVGRSLDSMFDLLGAAFAGLDVEVGLHRVPFSFRREVRMVDGRWRRRRLTAEELAQACRVLADQGLSPWSLARRSRPATFVDVVHEGDTFTELFGLLRRWILAEDRGSWQVIRRKLRFVGVTSRKKTSPNTYRWHQHADWPRRLPSGSVVNVSLDPVVWSHLADRQVKLTRSYRPDVWLADERGPGRDERTRQALAEAVALAGYGRSPQGRRDLARAVDGEPGLERAWLRRLVHRLRREG